MISNLWESDYVKGIVFYLVYIVVLFWVVMPLAKKFLVPLINKTRTNLDNEIYWRIKNILRILIALIWLNFVYKLCFSYFDDKIYLVAYNVLITIELVLAYIILHRTANVIIKHASLKFSSIVTKNVVNFMKITVTILLFSLFFLFILNAWWVNITPLLASAGIAGFAVAMASKSIIENFLSWMILLTDNSLNVWDVIVLSDWTAAKIEEINIRTTKLKTFDGSVLIIPNSTLLNEKITNKSLSTISPQKRLQVSVWISYWDDVKKAKELLEKYLKEVDGVDKETITVFVDQLADWSVNIVWRAMVDASKWSYLSEKQILEKVYEEFPKNWLHFPFPTYNLYGDLKIAQK